jgi:glycolate oxidase FAD binding subunit
MSSTITGPLAARLEAIAGAPHVRPALPADSVDGLEPELVVAPGTPEEAGAILRVAGEAGLGVIPRGGGTKLAWGNRPRHYRIILSTVRLARLLEHAHGDMTVTAEAGMTIAALQQALAAHGQMLALDPPWPERATLGGVTAADSSGPLRLRYGTLRDLIIGIGVALPDGTLARAGGKVVKNVAGYDLMRLWTGSLGTLGLITSLTLRLHPLPAITATLAVEVPSPEAAETFMQALSISPSTPTGAQIVAEGDSYTVYVRLAGVETSVAAQTEALLRQAEQAGLSIDVVAEDAAARIWSSHETIYEDAHDAVVARFSVLPSSTAMTLRAVREVAGRLGLRSRVVLQATGTGVVKLEGAHEQALAAGLGVLRSRVAESRGSLVVHACPAPIKDRIDVWGPAGDAHLLMLRIKEQFDPRGIMNPGRFIGGI